MRMTPQELHTNPFFLAYLYFILKKIGFKWV
jgi:hypothetical protein